MKFLYSTIALFALRQVEAAIVPNPMAAPDAALAAAMTAQAAALPDIYDIKLASLLSILKNFFCSDDLTCASLTLKDAVLTKLSALATGSLTEQKQAFVNYVKSYSGTIIQILNEMQTYANGFAYNSSMRSSLISSLTQVVHSFTNTIVSPDNYAADIGLLNTSLHGYLSGNIAPVFLAPAATS